jgi:hypothetical protein
MLMIGERVIEYLKSKTALTTLLGGSNNIFCLGLNEISFRPTSYIAVECSPGEDLNYLDAQQDSFDINICVSRKSANSFSTLMSLASMVDDLINKSEDHLSSSSWSIKSIVRDGSNSSGPMLDETTNEYYFVITYNYILSETV